MEKEKTRKVLILCTGNSCRSQMAEALINARLAGSWKAYSAGTNPAGFVHPLTLKVLSEAGIDHQGRSKHISDLPVKDFDLVVTVCDAAAENCPAWLAGGKQTHIGFPDPASVTGSPAEVTNTFRALRDAIELKLIDYLKNLAED